MDTKVCSKCGKRKRREAYGIKAVGNRMRSRCKKCTSVDRRAQYAIDSAPSRAASAAWRAAAPERTRLWFRNNHLTKKYGITSADVSAILRSQNDCCAVCQTKTPTKIGWAVDHDHATGKVRGILCSRCNFGIGYFLDSSDIAAAATTYLRLHGK